jgi:multidrug efflux pump subunit AcrA (membrane-fusion protein)
MAAITTLAVVGIGLAAAGTGYAIYSQQQAAKQQKKARRAQQRQQQLQFRRSQVQAARQAQIAAAQQRAAAAGLGGLETSGVLGGRAAIGAQLGAGLGFATQMSGLSRDISMFQQKAANAMGRAQLGQAVAGFGQQLFSAGGGFGGGQPAPTPALLPTSPISSQYTSVGYGSPVYT